MGFIRIVLLYFVTAQFAFAAPQFIKSSPEFSGFYSLSGAELCATGKQTLAYLNQGAHYDPQVNHEGKVLKIPLSRIKATLLFICQHQSQLNDPNFVKQHFDFIRWYPDQQRAKQLSAHKPLLKNIPKDRILMTKYYVHLAQGNTTKRETTPYPLYGLPKDEQGLSLEQSNAKSDLIRFRFGKQAVLKGALQGKSVPILAYLSREDLEAALLQGTVVADLGSHFGKKIFNVHRSNNIAYDRTKDPYHQERFWYFKQVAGIKGYGKDAEHKITVIPKVTFAADLQQFGLGKVMMIQYRNHSGALITNAGILADTGGAFADNLYQVDYLIGSYPGKNSFNQAVKELPDYVDAYFMVLKPSVIIHLKTT